MICAIVVLTLSGLAVGELITYIIRAEETRSGVWVDYTFQGRHSEVKFLSVQKRPMPMLVPGRRYEVWRLLHNIRRTHAKGNPHALSFTGGMI